MPKQNCNILASAGKKPPLSHSQIKFLESKSEKVEGLFTLNKNVLPVLIP